MDMVRSIAHIISEAYLDEKKLPGALIFCGVIQAAMALALLVFEAPGGIFLHHGKAPLYLYYGALIAVMVFGFLEASAGFWVSSNPGGRSTGQVGIFQHHGEALVYLYYGILIARVIFGLVEASSGFWVSGDLTNRRAVGKTFLWVSILPLVLVAGLVGDVLVLK
ncbi:hypothetical protein ACP4OV_026372 [Aristida adscensionis]